MALHNVTIIRRGMDDRTVTVRVTEEAVREACDHYDIAERRERTRALLARTAAAKRLYGRSCYWHGDGSAEHRGQVMTASRQGHGSDAVTGVITMRVD